MLASTALLLRLTRAHDLSAPVVQSLVPPILRAKTLFPVAFAMQVGKATSLPVTMHHCSMKVVAKKSPAHRFHKALVWSAVASAKRAVVATLSRHNVSLTIPAVVSVLPVHHTQPGSTSTQVASAMQATQAI